MAEINHYIVPEGKPGFFIKIKEDKNFNHRHTLSISRTWHGNMYDGFMTSLMSYTRHPKVQRKNCRPKASTRKRSGPILAVSILSFLILPGAMVSFSVTTDFLTASNCFTSAESPKRRTSIYYAKCSVICYPKVFRPN